MKRRATSAAIAFFALLVFQEWIVNRCRARWDANNRTDADVAEVYRIKGELQYARSEIAALQEWIRVDSKRWQYVRLHKGSR